MRYFGKLAFAGVSLLAMANPAFAQEAGDEGVSSDEIIVEARRKDESIQDVPLVVQAVTSEDIQKNDIRQFEDVTKLVPGLQLAANASGLGTTSSLRGVNFDANASGASTTVETYRNDSVMAAGALFQALYDVGQIEVLRGPQGTLRGRASPSGSITVTTRRPDLAEVGGFVTGSLSDQGRWNGNAAINVPILADKLAVRVAGFVGESEGNGIRGVNIYGASGNDSLSSRPLDKDVWDKNRALRASVRADPFDGVLVLDFNYETIHHFNRQYDQVQSFREVLSTAGASPLFISAKDRVGITPGPRTTDQRYKIYNWQAKLNLFGQALTYVGSRLDGKVNATASQDAAGLFASVNPVVASPTGYVQITDNLTQQESHEVRLQNEERIAGLFDYVVGYMKVDAASPSFLNNITAFASATTLYAISNLGLNRYREDSESSIFGNATLHLGDQFELSGGVRQIRFKANSGVQTGTYGADVSTYVESPSSRRCFGHPSIPGCLGTKKATIYSASAKYNIGDDAMVYASYGTSWRPGNSVIGFRGTEVGAQLNTFLNLPDEKSKSMEVGFKTSWLDNRLTLNLSAYKQKFTNYAFRSPSAIIALSNTSATPTLASGFNFVAPVDAKVTGLEAEIAFRASDNFNIAATIGYANGKIKNGVFPCLDLDDNNVPDLTVPTAAALYAHLNTATTGAQVDTCLGNTSPSSQPKWTGTVQAEYTHELGNNEAYLRGLVNWKGKNQGFTINPYDQVSSFNLLDLYLGLRDPDGAWDVSLFGKNILDTNRVLTRTDAALASSLRAGTNLAAFGGSGTSINTSNATNYLGITSTAPREFGVTVRFSFGSR